LASSLESLRESRVLLRGLVLAVLAVHVVLIVAPVDVLHPVDPWQIGRHLWRGDVPYRDFGFEYPPVALLAFLFPGAVPHDLAPSMLAMQAVLAEVVVVVAVLRHHAGAVLRYGLLSLAVFPFLSGGFDAVPMAAIAVSTALLVQGRGAGWWVAAGGALTKLSPGAAWVWARRPVAAALAALTVTAALGLAPLLLAGRADDTWVGWTLHRGVQVESVAGTTTWAAQRVTGDEPHFEYRYRSWEIDGAGAAGGVTAALAGVGLIVVAVAGRRQPWLAAFAAVLLIVAGSKVFSPQFVAWGAPLAAVIGGRWFGGYALLAGLTTAAYAAGTGPDSVMAVILVRNLVLLSLIVAALRQLLHPGPHPVDLGTEVVERP
jgi:hypothetical protein